MNFPHSFVATVSRREFLRLLPAAVGGDNFIAEGDVIEGESGWRMRLTALPGAEFGQAVLQRQQVAISFNGWSTGEMDAFMRRFSLYFQRGGG